MKLFENGIGRPSNETIKKRKRFYIVITVLIVMTLGIGGYFLFNSLSSGEIVGEEHNAKVEKKLNIFSYPGGGEPILNGYIKNGMGTYIVGFSHTYKVNGKLQKLYYRVTTYKKSNLNQVDPKVSTSSCKAINGPKDVSLPTTLLTKEVYAEIRLYSDKKCSTAPLDKVQTVHYLYDNSKPTITKACQRNGYVEVTAKDDYQIKNIAWIPSGTSCSKVTNGAKTAINNKSISSKKVKQKLTTTQKVKACVWDLAGNLREKSVDKKC